MHARRSGIHPLRIAIVGALILSAPLGAHADEEGTALDASYKQSGQLARNLAQQYESALRQTVVRLGEISRQNPADVARSPLALETARAQWPVSSYQLADDKATVSPPGRPLLTLTDLQELAGRKSGVYTRDGRVIVAVPADGNRVTATEIPLEAFTSPLDGFALKGGSLSLLDEQGRPLGRNALAADDQELVRSLAGDTTTTFVSKTSLLSLARIPTAGWIVVVQVPLTEAYRGIGVPELDERTIPYPLYIVKRAEKASMDGIWREVMLSFGGLAVLLLGLLIVRRRLKASGGERASSAEPFGGTRTAQEGGPSMLETLVGEKRNEQPAEALPSTPMPPLLQAPPDAAAAVWRDTMQAQITFLLDELRKTQDHLRGVAQMPRLGALEKRLEAEIESLSGAMRQRLDLEGKRLSSLESETQERFAAIDGQLSGMTSRWSEVSERATGVESQLSKLSESLQVRFEQEDRVLASLDQELSQVRVELEALWAQHRGVGELHEGKLSLLERELENYRNQGTQTSRQTNERIEVLAKGLHDLHGALVASQSERSEIRAELEALSERVHRVVKLIAKARPA